MGTGPIFIVGAPRSGTTLLWNVLNRHPHIAICRETEFRHYVYRRRTAFGSLADPRNRQNLVREYLSLVRIQRTRLDLGALEQCLMDEGENYPALFAALLRFYMRSHGKRRWGEKTPDHALFAETLLEWYPEATVIHLLRDPRDVVASLMDMPSFPNSALGNANMWLTFNRAAARANRRPGYALVRYETFVADPETELRRLCELLGEEYSPAMLVPNWDPTADRPWFQRAEQPITGTRVGIWRQRLTDHEAALVEWFIGSEMSVFGYERLLSPASVAAIAGGFAFAVQDAIRRRVGEFPGIWYGRASSTQLARQEAAEARYHNRIRLRRSSRQEWPGNGL